MGIKKPKGDGPNEYQSYQGPTGIIYICVCVYKCMWEFITIVNTATKPHVPR